MWRKHPTNLTGFFTWGQNKSNPVTNATRIAKRGDWGRLLFWPEQGSHLETLGPKGETWGSFWESPSFPGLPTPAPANRFHSGSKADKRHLPRAREQPSMGEWAPFGCYLYRTALRCKQSKPEVTRLVPEAPEGLLFVWSKGFARQTCRTSPFSVLEY